MHEWRIDVPELNFKNDDCVIITMDEKKLFELTQDEGESEEIIIDYVKDGQYIIENHQVQIPIRHYKGVSFEDINEWCQTKHDLNELLSWQIVSNID